MQHPAAHYLALRHTATHCNTLQLVLQYVGDGINVSVSQLHTFTLQHAATFCNILQHTWCHRLYSFTPSDGDASPPERERECVGVRARARVIVFQCVRVCVCVSK